MLMTMQEAERWTAIKINAAFVFPELLTIAESYGSNTLDKYFLAVYSVLEYVHRGDPADDRATLISQLVNQHKKNCKAFNRRKIDNIQRMTVYDIVNMAAHNDERAIIAPPLTNTKQILNTVFAEIFLNQKDEVEVAQELGIEPDRVPRYYYLALNQRALLFENVKFQDYVPFI